jgi:hypothetical protein
MFKFGSIATVAALAVAVAPTMAAANTAPVDGAKAQALAGQIEAGLLSIGCSATVQDDTKVIQQTIAASGVQPIEAQVALLLVKASPGLCPTALPALLAVNQSIVLAMQGSPAPTAGGETSGVSPLGAPLSVTAVSGTDYVASQ